ncbi:MAG: hypothetical protein Q8N14_06320 [Candidatus Omnitrophota bacterium]|nr:hypothetical protein [Candidatus Omnitrophota bacterium]
MNNKTRSLAYLMVIGLVVFFCAGYALSEENAMEVNVVLNEEISIPANDKAAEVTVDTEVVIPTSAPAAVNAESVISNTEAVVAAEAGNIMDETVQPITGSVLLEETKWVWAEVTAVNTASSQFTIKYLSYDSDDEKELILSVDNTTKLENFKSLSEMAAGDNVSVDYLIDQNGKAIAKSISLQKAKSATEITEPVVPASTAAAVSEPAAIIASVNAIVEATAVAPATTVTTITETIVAPPATIATEPAVIAPVATVEQAAAPAAVEEKK